MDYRAEVRLKNNRILQRIEDAGFVSILSFCKKFGLAYMATAEIVRLRAPALKADGTFRKVAVDLAVALGCETEELFTERQAKANLSPLAVRRISEDEALSLAAPEMRLLTVDSCESDVEYKCMASKAIGQLHGRQREIIERRFGLLGRVAETLEEIGDSFGVSRDRVRQIEAKALQKLRKPSNRRMLSGAE